MRRIREEPPEELRRAVDHLRRVVYLLPVLIIVVVAMLASW
ncbi:morphogenic membrane protein MmpB [Yinghuangia sp. YIM S09857]